MNAAMAYARLVRPAIKAACDLEMLDSIAEGSPGSDEAKNLRLQALRTIADITGRNVEAANSAARVVPESADLVIELRGAVGDMVSDCGKGRVANLQSLCNRLEAVSYTAEHPTETIAALIEAREFVEHYRCAGGDMRLDAHWVGRKINATPGVDYLRAMAEGEGESFSATWLRKLRGRVIVAKGESVATVDAMKVEDFLSLLASKPVGQKSRLTISEANDIARPILSRNPEITARKLAAEVGCAVGQVPKLPAWRVVKTAQQEGRKPKRGRGGGNVVDIADTTGAVGSGAQAARAREAAKSRDDELDRLIAEQQDDYEPSSADPDLGLEPPRIGTSF